MALYWDMQRVKDFDTLDKGRAHGLIWATMAVGLGSITEANCNEFYFRLSVYERLFDAFQTDSEDRPAPYLRRDVERCVGLKTNVSDMTRAAWWKTVRERAEHEAGVK